MSYARWGMDGSSVYIYHDVNKGLFCCSCALGRAEGAPYGFATGDDYDAMLAHVAAHRAAGDVVPEYVDEDLRIDRAALDVTP